MKKFILPFVLMTALFTACKTEPKKDIEVSKQLLLTPDSNLYKSDASSDVAKISDNNTADNKTPVVTKTIIQRIYMPAQKQVKQQAPVATPDPVVTATPPVITPTVPVVTTVPSTSTIPAETDATAPAENKKKGISDAAKGAAIGGVGGAVAGAIIGKGGKGAIIGGVVGAAGGYILGRQKDKKSGRIEYALD